ncbi:MAG: ycdF 2 [Planctomycetaceae bacterium]|nr:ycdF 2 [Planctomycetaceae bacterium]
MSSATIGKRVALVTGSGKKRIGWHIADALAGRGYDIAVHYRSSAAEAVQTVEHLRSRGVEAEAFQADLANEGEVQVLVRTVVERFGRLDVLVNCAAIYHAKRLEEVTAADLRDNFDANLLGTFLCSQQVGLMMVQQPDGGCIVNFGDWALARPYRDYAAYFATKGGIPALTRCLAVELGARNPRVRVNCIHPGPILFPPDMPIAEQEKAVRATLVKRKGEPENIASTVLFFLDNEFVTGVCIPVDGGRTIYSAGD